MKPFMIRPAVLGLTLLIGVACATAEDTGWPRIEFDTTIYDFGLTSNVQRVEGAFTVRNTGQEELRIHGLGSTCGCTRAWVEPDKLKPGETGQLSFYINIGPSVGNILEYITVRSNDPQQSNVILTLKVRVQPIFEVNPQRIELGDLRLGSSTNVTVLITRTDDKKLQITKVESDPPLVTARAVPMKESKGKSVRLLLNVEPERTPGPLRATVYVHTGEFYTEDIPKPSFEIDVSGRVVQSSQ